LAPSDAGSVAKDSEPMLLVKGISTGFGKKRVLDDVGLNVKKGEAVAILGHNGAGKTTLLQTIYGLQPVWSGSLYFDGKSLDDRHAASEAVALGMGMIPSERFVFPDLTVLENLRLSGRGLEGVLREQRLEEAYDDFPILSERAHQLAGSLSGGQQRMVSLAMVLMHRPRLLLLDEPSLGLSPAIAEQIMARVRGLASEGTSIVLVEQNIAIALSVADRIYVLRSGRIILEESARELENRGREKWWELF
jgi:branched-chain amino acid transport system ATP-binding protein